MSPKIVVVMGATGSQGGAVVDALLASQKYTVRGITRSKSSASAKGLAAKGVELAEADASDKASLIKAFAGAYAVFGVTSVPNEDEAGQGRNIVDACKDNKVELFVWSSLPNATTTSGGKYTGMSHFDNKAAVDEYIKEVGQPAVTVHLSVFTDNLTNFGLFAPASDGSAYNIYMPVIRAEVSLPNTWVSGDLGPAIAAIIDKFDDQQAKATLTKAPILLCSYSVSGSQMAQAITRITGKKVNYVVVPAPADNEDLAQMYHYMDDGFYGDPPLPPKVLVDLGVKFSTFDDYINAKILPAVKAHASTCKIEGCSLCE